MISKDLKKIKKGKDFHRGIFVNFHQKLVVYYILDYFGILFILDINSVLNRIHIVGSETFEGICF